MKRVALQRRTRVNPVSAKRAAIRAERRAFVERVIRERRDCEAHRLLRDLAFVALAPPRPAVDVHELTRRSQGSPIVPTQGLREEDTLALCRACHRFVTENPRIAVALRLARWGMRGG